MMGLGIGEDESDARSRPSASEVGHLHSSNRIKRPPSCLIVIAPVRLWELVCLSSCRWRGGCYLCLAESNPNKREKNRMENGHGQQ